MTTNDPIIPAVAADVLAVDDGAAGGVACEAP
jgi:hypothetical protein